jgi:CheY-like chemotaxis protein
MNKRALVVDDSRSARVILSRMLEAHGVQVDTAESGEQALDYVRTATPDVIFMDQLMPGMDGLQALRMLKSDARTHSIPVMMYTSQDDAEYVQRARAYGAIGVLSKTLTPTDVSHALYQQLKLVPDRRESSMSALSIARLYQVLPCMIWQRRKCAPRWRAIGKSAKPICAALCMPSSRFSRSA